MDNMEEVKQKLIDTIEEGMAFELAEIKSHLAGDGSLWGRMNATDGGAEMSPFIKEAIEYCVKKGIDSIHFDAEVLAGYYIETAQKNAK